jgi:hypothetical protein
VLPAVDAAAIAASTTGFTSAADVATALAARLAGTSGFTAAAALRSAAAAPAVVRTIAASRRGYP